ncbi:PepSY domain-containing protein [Sphingomonas sp. GM_Shp_2]|uniref:PepSY domain-containing protein n=1 Tax=Sphingomonas sp. GM_Shp_2 TaxID=2937380 RepID=UPI002269C891
MPRSDIGRVALRWLFLTHRWAGIAACLFFGMWFASGLVMLYMPYPALSPAARWAGAAPIDWSRVDVPAPLATGQGRLLLEMRDTEPVWRIERDDGVIDTVPARNGAVLPAVDHGYARRVAANFSGTRAIRADQVMHDQWTVAGGFDRHRPLWRVALGDAAGTDIYVSSATGLPVQRTKRVQRIWNWLGSVPHWLYPTVLRQDNAAWRQAVMWVSGPCIAVALTGIWIGILRLRPGQRRYKAGRISPYRGWMLWHHVSGLVGGVFLLGWIVSGWLSVDPGRLFAGGTAPVEALRRYRAIDGDTGLAPARLAMVAPDARTIEITNAAGLPRVVVDRASDHPRFLDARTMAHPGDATAVIVKASAPLVAGGALWRIDRLTRSDAYWGLTRPLPILRLRFDNHARTWLYIDPATGDVVERQDRARRLYRWMFDLPHTWDWLWLVASRPVRDLVIWLMSAFGLVVSVSGVWLGYRRLLR